MFLFLYKNNFNKLYWYDSLIGMIFYYLFMLVDLFDERAINSVKNFFSYIAKKIESKKSSKQNDEIEMSDEDVNDLNAIKKVKFMPVVVELEGKNVITRKHKNRELNFDKSSSDSSISSGSEKYEEPYDLIEEYKHFRKQDNFVKFKLCLTLPARLIAFVSKFFYSI